MSAVGRFVAGVLVPFLNLLYEGDMGIKIPAEDVYVVQCEQMGSSLALRFVKDFHPDAPICEQVLKITIEGVENVSACADFFRDLMHVKPIYLELDGDNLTATAGAGVVLSINASAISASYVEASPEELRKQVDWVHEWYRSAQRGLTKANARIKAVRDLTVESVRRIEVKAAGHSRDGTASILYEQQLYLLKRILQALDD
jgi:hypothetical protein